MRCVRHRAGEQHARIERAGVVLAWDVDLIRNHPIAWLKVVGAVSFVALVLAFFLTRSVTGPVREAVGALKKVAAGGVKHYWIGAGTTRSKWSSIG